MNAMDKPADLPAVQGDAGSIMAVIARAASDPTTDVNKLERLLAMFERIKAAEAQAAYVAALAEMQPTLPVINEKGAIMHGDKLISNYAKWEDINDAIKPILAEHGFALDFAVAESAKGIAVTAMLTHRAGYSKSATVPLPLDTSGAKNPVQAVGSTLSYGQRYAARMVLNITSRAPEDRDDDGKSAGAGGAGRITSDQAKNLDHLIQETETDIAKFYRVYRVGQLGDLPAADYPTAVADLEMVKAKRAAKAREVRK